MARYARGRAMRLRPSPLSALARRPGAVDVRRAIKDLSFPPSSPPQATGASRKSFTTRASICTPSSRRRSASRATGERVRSSSGARPGGGSCVSQGGRVGHKTGNSWRQRAPPPASQAHPDAAGCWRARPQGRDQPSGELAGRRGDQGGDDGSEYGSGHAPGAHDEAHGRRGGRGRPRADRCAPPGHGAGGPARAGDVGRFPEQARLAPAGAVEGISTEEAGEGRRVTGVVVDGASIPAKKARALPRAAHAPASLPL